MQSHKLQSRKDTTPPSPPGATSGQQKDGRGNAAPFNRARKSPPDYPRHSWETGGPWGGRRSLT